MGGTIFWRVENVTKMILGTSDPSGDVWHHCRSSFMQAVSNVSFDVFMGAFNALAKDAYNRDVADGFYTERGVSLLSMEEQTQAELRLEGHKTNLIRTRIGNDLLQKKADAEGDAQPFAQHAKSFITALNETGVDVSSGLGLYRTLRQAEHHNKDTENLASGKATLFLTSDDVKLNLRNLNLGGSNSSSNDL